MNPKFCNMYNQIATLPQSSNLQKLICYFVQSIPIMSTISPDLSVFKHISSPKPHSSSDPVNFKSCAPITRLHTALKYYTLLDKHRPNYCQDVLTEFSHNVYPIEHLLNDYHHLIKSHSEVFHEINQYLVNQLSIRKCEIQNCGFTSRHHRASYNDGNEGRNILHPKPNLYADTLDSLHFRLFHLYDTGLRTLKNEYLISVDDKKDGKTEDIPAYDASFAQMKDLVNSRNHTTKSFERFKTANNQNSKFNIKINDNVSKNISDDHDDTESALTFMDQLFKHLEESAIDENVLNKLRAYIENEEFETDAIDIDVSEHLTNGNISNHVQNEECMQSIIAQITSSHCMMCFCFFLYIFVNFRDIASILYNIYSFNRSL